MAGLASSAIGKGFEVVFRGIKHVRRHRPIHSRGLRLDGTVVVHDHGRTSGISWIDRPSEGPATARVSRSAGTPDGLPDIVGLAVRVHHPASGPTPSTFSDILLSSTGWAVPGRFLLVPRLSVSRAPLSTMMPYRGDSGPVLLAARTLGPAGLPSSLRGFARSLGASPWQLGLYFATPRGPWQHFGTLTLRLNPAAEEKDLRFDAVLHPLAGAGTYDWARTVREPSYALSRRESGDS
ncbi:hypothetical protein [Arthrobacter agilis]|uniref:hypothetical protein n=1 Tax=Arthrobacter agilis TaxID=37921 RepID=UPI002786628E|nr:hypothetical protein [Arthrobacter agilis]MDQ0733961.1 hypothetical protein [Arthrobacter agilis]